MKRYQCIKNVIDLDYEGHSYISFSAGYIYEMDDDGNMRDNKGFKALFLPSELNEHFHELLDLHVDDYAVDQDERHVYPVASPSVSLGCAIAIAAAISAGFLIYKIITWNS